MGKCWSCSFSGEFLKTRLSWTLPGNPMKQSINFFFLLQTACTVRVTSPKKQQITQFVLPTYILLKGLSKGLLSNNSIDDAYKKETHLKKIDFSNIFMFTKNSQNYDALIHHFKIKNK